MRILKATLIFLLAVSVGILAGLGSNATPTLNFPEEYTPEIMTKPDIRWPDVDRLVSEQKFEKAYETVEVIHRDAREAQDSLNWTRALIREVQLRTGLHGYETAVRHLREQAWPEEPWSRAVLELYYARSILHYLQMYSWEIGQREKIETEDLVDLKRWTREDLLKEANQAYSAAWSERHGWGTLSLGPLSEYFQAGSYPERIRGTLRDTVTYLWVDFLEDEALWSAADSHGVYRLDPETLLKMGPGTSVDPTSAEFHPLERISFLLGDLKAWHRRGDRPEAALEASRVLIERLHGSFKPVADRATLREALDREMQRLGRDWPWWSMGQWTLAQFVDAMEDPEHRIRARELALEGLEAHPDSEGGMGCAALVDEIEAPHFTLTAMQSDGPGERSIQVDHRNLNRLHFRAWRLDLRKQVTRTQDYNLLPRWREIPETIMTTEPQVSWSSDLARTPDYRNHKTFLSPPMEDLGLWVVVASADPSFKKSGNKRVAINLILSEMVVEVRPRAKEFELEVRRGEDGTPMAGVEVELWRRDYQKRHQLMNRGLTQENGQLTLGNPGDQWQEYFVLARKNGDTALSMNLRRHYRSEPGSSTGALVFTDRAVYRPGQKILWKTVAYRGKSHEGSYRVLEKAHGTVELFDANGEKIASQAVTTNDYGSASGEFTAESGRLLGGWSIRSSWNGTASIRVEEYKRPTFEVSLEDSKEVLRLNRPATLQGEARYFFGLPVTEGEVEWRVTRSPVSPPWWPWWRPAPSTQPEVVAVGSATLNEVGGFEVQFTPEADERKAGEGLSYRFEVSVDLTDLGGETRSSSRTFRLGFVTVESSLSPNRTFGLTHEPFVISVRRTDLDGTPRTGEATWTLHRLEQPESASMPAHWPLPVVESEKKWASPGDAQRPRWQSPHRLEEILGLWEPGKGVKRGELIHDNAGLGEIRLEDLPQGAYRLDYRTEDPWGGVHENSRDFVMVNRDGGPLAVPAFFEVEKSSVEVGETAKFLVGSGFNGQEVVFEVFQKQKLQDRRILRGGDLQVVEIPIDGKDRGGLTARISMVRDFQMLQKTLHVSVPWTERRLALDFSTFRDRLRPGQKETWRVTVRDAENQPLELGAAEVLASMYDRSLDLFAPYNPPSAMTLYPAYFGALPLHVNLAGVGEIWHEDVGWGSGRGAPSLYGSQLVFYGGYAIGGMGRRDRMAVSKMKGMAVPMAAPMAEQESLTAVTSLDDSSVPPPPVSCPPEVCKSEDKLDADGESRQNGSTPRDTVEVRTNFSETAFFYPHLLLEDDGSVAFEFEVPDSVTEWKVWVHALTKDLKGGSTTRETKSVKELLVRPYLPRFLRQGDQAEIEVVVSNTGEETLEGMLDFALFDPETEEDLGELFGLEASQQAFEVKAGGSTNLRFGLEAPVRLGEVAIRATARAAAYSDGEQRAIPVLPSRLHLVQSRFAALQDEAMRTLRFADLSGSDDPSLLNEKLVVTLDGQLFYTVLQALPYLVDYPYECTEQTLNRFLSTAIVNSVFEDYPQVAEMALSLAKRDTQLEAFDEPDPNRKMLLEESPWLMESRGGEQDLQNLIRVLDPKVAQAQQRESLKKLEKMQTSLGGFPWWPGGPPSPYMTLYLLNGFSRAIEFGVEVPQSTVKRAWSYLHRHYIDEIAPRAYEKDCCWETITFLNYILSAYPDASWTGGVFSEAEREKMLDFSFKHWKKHSPLLKGYLALTLHRKGRSDEARLVFDSVMDSAKTDRDLGTYWAPEDRAWLWYNDTIESHAFTLRALSELDPEDERRQGLVQWIMLDKKLSHWKSTRATAEVIYSLVHFLEQEDQLGVREEVLVEVGDQKRTFVFEPDEYTGKKNQWTFEEEAITPDMGTITVEKDTPGLLFASATWHFSTEKLPEKGEGDFFFVDRIYFRRIHNGKEWTLHPLRDGETIEVGDQLEVQLALRTKHAAEYVHLRDPRGAGFEPETLTSGFRWQTGLGYYEEVRDSGANFFFEWLPVGEYTFKYRLRAATAGKFRVGPATVQSMYAPEFAAYSGGQIVEVKPAELNP